jgi:hypothetical protein
MGEKRWRILRVFKIVAEKRSFRNTNRIKASKRQCRLLSPIWVSTHIALSPIRYCLSVISNRTDCQGSGVFSGGSLFAINAKMKRVPEHVLFPTSGERVANYIKCVQVRGLPSNVSGVAPEACETNPM